MSAGIRIPQQVDGFDTLRELIALAKDPSAIIAASETARKEMALTEAEKAKSDEARGFIAKYDQLAVALKTAQDKLAADKASHETAIAEFKAHVEAESGRLVELSVGVAVAKKQNDQDAAALAEARKQHTVDKAGAMAELQAKVEKLHSDLSDVEKVRAANMEEKFRLANVESILKAKAAKLRETAADF